MNKMNRKRVWQLMIVLGIGMLALWGCPKKAEVSAVPETQREEAPAVVAAQPEQKTEPAKAEAIETKEQAAAAPVKGLQSVYFDFDQSSIRGDASEALKANAEWLKAHPQSNIKIEGNCDERGTKEYNQALGQRRAANAKKYLANLGISERRISLVSYGKEKPGCTESTESCWQMNRRDEFIVMSE